jgi:hypothetical protein
MARDYAKAIKWIIREIEELEETIAVRTKAGLTNYNFPEEFEVMKEIKGILEEAQKHAL